MSSSQGVLFLRNVYGESEWFEDGDEKNDGEYTGEIKNGKPNGTGSITFPDGDKYVGEFKDGLPNGKGTFFFPDGSKYYQNWRIQQMEGIHQVPFRNLLVAVDTTHYQ